MCGIAGIVQLTGQKSPTPWLDLVQSAQAHRGPDDDGWLQWNQDAVHMGRGRIPSEAASVTLLHRRLSILDLSEFGRQPMSSSDGRYHITFNGEIYNYVELRRELESAGHRFRTSTDTEVLLHGFMHWGDAVLNRLVGMFAFAVLDTRERSVSLARDYFGIKPLYYYQGSNIFAFASELPALLQVPTIKRCANPQAVYDYLRHGAIDHGAATMFQGIYQLPPAHRVRVYLDRPAQVEPKRYWEFDIDEPYQISRADAVDKVRATFLENIQLHLRSDVRVGMALSGGIDSSAIVAATRAVGGDDLPIHTFSFVADDSRISEEKWIDLASSKSNTASHKVTIAPEDLVSDLDRLVAVQGTPFGSTSIYAQYKVFECARRNDVKVMLDGQGADELFGGYLSYLPFRIASLLRARRWSEAYQFAKSITRHSKKSATSMLLAGCLKLLPRKVISRLPSTMRTLLRSLVTRERAENSWLNCRWLGDHDISLESPAEQCFSLRQRLNQGLLAHNLPSLLRYDDRNSMAHSVESRVPFLTPSLAQFVTRLPESYLIDQEGTTKSVFREAMRGIVDDQILDRRDKIGFETPELQWLQTVRDWAEQVLNSECARRIPALNHAEMVKDWEAVVAGRRKFDWRVWRWLNMIRWTAVFDVQYDG